ncbi:CvpA family protein [Acetobacter sp. DsW_063]|uniref:CvpA family protein n=1 Tax=Acetobacter sp. DsW_063 TaxID=1514894 RepID=UPI0013020F95|nr:CvpA family protein [Acetobacter sp. DsW_063]
MASLTDTSVAAAQSAAQSAALAWRDDLFAHPPGTLGLAALGLVAISTLFGVWRGFSREVLSLASWIVALALTGAFHDQATTWLSGQISNHFIAYWLGVVGTFAVLLVLCRVVASRVSRLVLLSPFAGLDRLLGGVFGALRGFVVVAAMYALSTWVSPAYHWAAQMRDNPLMQEMARRTASEASHLAPLLPKFAGSGLAPPGGSRHDLAERKSPDASGSSTP